MRDTQSFQKPIIRKYALNHNYNLIQFEDYSLVEAFWQPWVQWYFLRFTMMRIPLLWFRV